MTSPHWPLSGLSLRTPRLELRWPSLADLDALGSLAAEGVHDPAVQPFEVPWTDAPAEDRARGTLQFHWSQWGSWSPSDWNLSLVADLDGTVVGTQAMGAKEFAIVGEVHTGSWLGQRYHGQGIGTEMRAAVLYLAFEGLHARYAWSAAFEDNAASLGVSRKLGYADDGIEFHVVRGRAVTTYRLRLDRDAWAAHQSVPVEISGLEPCLPSFGVTG